MEVKVIHPFLFAIFTTSVGSTTSDSHAPWFNVCYSQNLIEKLQRRLVTAVVLCMLIVMLTTISWGIPLLLARLPPASGAETNLPPLDSEEGIDTRAALSTDSFVFSAVDRY
jgi:hypothetical protein